jgi:enoyl-CoA hydratase
MSSIEGTVLEELKGPVVVLRLSRPGRRNAVGKDMTDALIAALDRWASDDRARACVLTGAGAGAFSSGADVGRKDTHTTPVETYLAGLAPSGHPVFDRMLQFPKPLVAAVSGYAIGWGFLACLACDVIVASKSAEFRLPQVRLGVLPAYAGVSRLAQWVGRGRAMEIAMRGRKVEAEEAERIGLVSAVCEDCELQEVAYAIAEECAAAPPFAVKLMKASVYQALEGELKPAAAGDLYRLGLLEQTNDVRLAHGNWRAARQATSRRGAGA